MAKSRGQRLADSVTSWSGGVGEVVCQLREVLTEIKFDRQTGALEGLDAGLYIVTAKNGVMSSGAVVARLQNGSHGRTLFSEIRLNDAGL